MKIVYFLKKGLQCYPPCLAQVLFANDYGLNLTIYHGKNSDYIEKMLEDRKIEHHTLSSDSEVHSTFQSFIHLIKYTKEAKKIIKHLDKDAILWFGNMESILTIGDYIFKHKIIFSVLELYDYNSFYDKKVNKICNKTSSVICCEKHRSVQMKYRYNLNYYPLVVPNKPYEYDINFNNLDIKLPFDLNLLKDKKVIVYQGILYRWRNIDNVAKALRDFNDDNYVLLVVGRADDTYKQYLTSLYKNTFFAGYIPSPQHLFLTKLAYIGVALYENSTLNSEYCAPNKIYEYSKFGIPIICSNNLSLKETIGDSEAGICIDFGCVHQVLDAIRKIDQNYNQYKANSLNFYNKIDCKKIYFDYFRRELDNGKN